MNINSHAKDLKKVVDRIHEFARDEKVGRKWKRTDEDVFTVLDYEIRHGNTAEPRSRAAVASGLQTNLWTAQAEVRWTEQPGHLTVRADELQAGDVIVHLGYRSVKDGPLDWRGNPTMTRFDVYADSRRTVTAVKFDGSQTVRVELDNGHTSYPKQYQTYDIERSIA